VSLLSERMQGMVSATTGVRTFALVDAEGTIVASNRRELIGSDWRNGVPYREISAHPDSLALYISPPYTTRLGSWAFSLGRAIVDRKGGFDGYILAIIDPGYFSPLFESTRHTSDTSTAMIHGGGTVIYRVPDPESSVGMNLAELPDSLFSKHIQSGRDATSWTGVLRTTGREALIVFQTIRPSTSPSDGFLVASFGRETSAIFAPWRRELKDRVALLAVVVLASTLGLYFSQRSRAVTARTRAEREAERRKAEEALAANEAKYRGLFNSLMDGFVVVGMDGVIRESNEQYRKMLGYSAEELAPRTYKDLTPERWHPVDARIVAEQVLPRGYSEVYEKEYRRKDGTTFPVELRTFLLKEDGLPVAMWAIVRDVTDVRAIQMKLAVAGRMAALGTLVSGVAHEINNPLSAEMADQGVALEVVREVRERLRGDSPIDRGAEGRALDGVVEALEDAQEAGARIARIVKDLTVFGRPDAKRQRARLMDIVDGAMRWLPATVARSVAIQVENAGAPDIVASAGQIEQILVNLVTNAAKATPEGQRDTVVVRVGPGQPGMARVEVIDHGIGIDPAIRNHIFDPFFTTRPAGPERGTGLGLAISQSIVTAHGGTITVESEVGKGSTFRVELPAAPAEA
jgi:PAS domain S-box-containing protein